MMRLAMLASASAIAFAFTIGSVSAADFMTLKGVNAVQMSPSELSVVKGMDHHFGVNLPNDSNPNTAANGLLNPPASSSAIPQLETGTQAPGRFSTSHHQDAGDENGFFMLGTRLVAPSYHGFTNASCNGVITVPGFATCL